jgi:hypothetical protein
MVTLAQLESSIESVVSFAADVGFLILFTVATGILVYLVSVTFTIDEIQAYSDAAVLFVEEWGVRILVAVMVMIVINLVFHNVTSMNRRMLAASFFCRWAVDIWTSLVDAEQLLALRSELTAGLIGCFRLFLLVAGVCVLMPLGALLYSLGGITRPDALVNWPVQRRAQRRLTRKDIIS